MANVKNFGDSINYKPKKPKKAYEMHFVLINRRCRFKLLGFSYDPISCVLTVISDQYRSSRMGKLSELVKKRSELELQIITLLQSTKDRYEATNSGITASLEKRLANLR